MKDRKPQKKSDWKCCGCECDLNPQSRRRCCTKDHCQECLIEHFREAHKGDAS